MYWKYFFISLCYKQNSMRRIWIFNWSARLCHSFHPSIFSAMKYKHLIILNYLIVETYGRESYARKKRRNYWDKLFASEYDVVAKRVLLSQRKAKNSVKVSLMAWTKNFANFREIKFCERTLTLLRLHDINFLAKIVNS